MGKLGLGLVSAAFCGMMMVGCSDQVGSRGAGDGEGNQVVVYCAHDSVYSADVLNAFEKETGIEVLVKYDTEATKSLGLTELLIAEKDDAKCDVFWNNQLLGTADLASKGVLESYKGKVGRGCLRG